MKMMSTGLLPWKALSMLDNVLLLELWWMGYGTRGLQPLLVAQG